LICAKKVLFNEKSDESSDNLSKPAPERLTVLDFTGAIDDRVVVASAGPYANQLHLTPDR